MKTPAFVFFDLDGVLIDSEPHHAIAESILCRELSGGRMTGIGFDATGTSTYGVYRSVVDQLHIALDPAVLVRRHFEETFASLSAVKEPAMPGLLPLLDALDARLIPYAVVSSSARSYVENVLQYLCISARFRFCVFGDEVMHVKPAPDPYEKALSIAGVAPTDALVIEDSRAGVQAANAAGIFSIGFDRGVGQDLSDASMRIAALSDVMALLGQ